MASSGGVREEEGDRHPALVLLWPHPPLHGARLCAEQAGQSNPRRKTIKTQIEHHEGNMSTLTSRDAMQGTKRQEADGVSGGAERKERLGKRKNEH